VTLVGTPLVRTEDGSILGPDYRRIPGFARPETNVPGVVAASFVMPGDTVRLAGQDLLVVTTREHGRPDTVYIGIRNQHGAEIVHEFRSTERVHVTAVGAFDR
jgi:hypothetical protein